VAAWVNLEGLRDSGQGQERKGDRRMGDRDKGLWLEVGVKGYERMGAFGEEQNMLERVRS
jgi:hypothetical protein